MKEDKMKEDRQKAEKMAELLDIDPNELLAKAEKIDPELKRIVTEKQAELANFLRTADGMSSAQLKQMAEAAEKRRKTIRLDSYRPTDLLRLMDNPRDQLAEIAELIQPAAPDIDRDAVRQAAGAFSKAPAPAEQAVGEPAGENLD